ncbi:hypothetical protein WDU94_005364 [Cyamophila willieti]
MVSIVPELDFIMLVFNIYSNGLKDITTVYEINTLQSDMEDVKYLNTCTVSVHVPAEDAQLPLFNMDSNGSIPEKNIPPLYSRPTLTKWKRLDGSDILRRHTMKASLEDETSEEIIQLPGHELDRVIQTAELERVLAKVNIPSWTGKKRIRIDGDNIVLGNIWESTELDQYKIERPKSCIKSNRMEIYNTLERSGGTREPVDNCFNGGRLKNATCICPPGFTGTQCELPCGRNTFGQTCSSVCSNDCRGTILCTPDYGCTCAPGYYGDKCVEECKEGTYGADCTQTCDQCKNGCDRYTGACRGDCSKPYLIRPYCRQTHSYLKKALEILETTFNSIKIQVDLTYREENSMVWNKGPSQLYSPNISNIWVDGLNPGRYYEFRVVLIDETWEPQDPSYLNQ